MKIGFCSLLFLIFMTLKLTDVIDWSWFWVFSPLWGGFLGIAALVFMLVLIDSARK